MSKKYTILKSDMVNTNGRSYPKEALEQSMESINKGLIFTTMDYSGPTLRITDVVGQPFDATIEDGVLKVSLKILDTSYGKVLKDLLKNGGEFSLSSAGTGTLDDDNVVQDFKMTSLFISSDKNAFETEKDSEDEG